MTAVEYFNQEIKELFNMHQDGEISGKMFHMSRLVALTKAKEMEKEQSECICVNVIDRILDESEQGKEINSKQIFEDVYNETFKSE
jgi:hypothetical protein